MVEITIILQKLHRISLLRVDILGQLTYNYVTEVILVGNGGEGRGGEFCTLLYVAGTMHGTLISTCKMPGLGLLIVCTITYFILRCTS